MQLSRFQGLRVEGIAACVPEYEIDNREFGKELYGESLESLIRAVGVEKRRVCKEKNVTSLDFSVRAAEVLLEQSGVAKEQIGGVVFVTLTPDSLMPNNATYTQHLLGLPNDVAALDINHACSGYVYGLWVSSMMATTLQKKVLLLDGDTNSYYVSERDKSTAILFGDAGSATLIGPEQGSQTQWFFGFHTDGSKRDVLTIPGLGFRNLLSEESLKYKTYEDGSQRRLIDMTMNGQEVFGYVVQHVPKILLEFMGMAETSVSDLDYLVLHQANAFMLRQLARKIKFPLNKMPISINKYGNTSSTSIPLNICSELKEEISGKDRHRILTSGFGAGLSTAAGIIDLGDCVCPGVIPYE
ncbi:MAG TPA: ketoacyl-ACP synthase III [Thermotogota bacterium]|nr:ketoacyl-ACP synthase III [Thermotogota bacterium]HRW93781.1 ketoacyl-ACP synthase III [Thermotogota bacterium]